MNPSVSIILPYYEGHQWLTRSIESVRAQDVQSWELIIVDDGSAESPLPLIRSFEDPRIRFFRTVHSGKGSALNKGALESKAGLLCFIDQDDLMMPGRVLLQLGVFQNNANVEACYSDYRRIHDDGRLIDHFMSRQATNPEILCQMARGVSLISMQTLMIRKATFVKLGGFSNDIALSGLDDAEFFIRLLLSDAVLKYQPGIVQSWVLHDRNFSISDSFQETRLVLLRHLSENSKTYPELGRYLSHFKYHTHFMRGIHFLEKGSSDEALHSFLLALVERPLDVNTHYLILKSVWNLSLRRCFPTR